MTHKGWHLCRHESLARVPDLGEAVAAVDRPLLVGGTAPRLRCHTAMSWPQSLQAALLIAVLACGRTTPTPVMARCL
jgi:hypothetical protein